MIRFAMISCALLASTPASATGQLSDYVRGIYEQQCAKQDASACSQLINAGPGVPDASLARALLVRATARLRANDAASAKQDLLRALEIANTGQDSSMAKLDAARGIAPLSSTWRSTLHARLAEAFLMTENATAAQSSAEKAIASDPRNALGYAIRGRLNGSAEKWQAAIADFDKALQLGIADPFELGTIYYYRGLSRLVLKQPPASQLADYNAALKADPSLIRVYETRGDLFYDLDRYEDAVRDYDVLVSKAPRYAVALNSACWIRAAKLKRDFDAAKALCDRALALDPSPNNHDSAGLVALQQGRWQDAWTHYDTAVKGDAKMASARYGRGVAAKRLGRAAEASADIAAATTLDATVGGKFAGYGHAP